MAARLEDQKVPWLSLGQGNLVNKMYLQLQIAGSGTGHCMSSVIATVKCLALSIACVGASVSTNMRKRDGQRELEEEAGKSKKKEVGYSYTC